MALLRALFDQLSDPMYSAWSFFWNYQKLFTSGFMCPSQLFTFGCMIRNMFPLFRHFIHLSRKKQIFTYFLLFGAVTSYWNLQVQNPHNIKYNGTIQGLKYIWRTEGFRGLFKGNGTNCARIVPNSAVKFFSYEQASKYDPIASLMLH